LFDLNVDPRLRNIIVGVVSAGLAVWLGYALAEGGYFLASIIAALCVWTLIAWLRGPLAEAWILAFLVFAYVLGNRGFAQVTPVGGLPLFFGEIGLGITLAILMFRFAFKRELPIRRDWLNSMIVLWLALGIGRMFFDVRTYGFVALRDFATLYYAFFLFVAQAATQDAASRALLSKVLTTTFALLPITSLLSEAFPEFFLGVLTFRGIPVILYKGDLLATFLFAGFIWLMPRQSFDRRSDWWWATLAILSLGLGLYYVSRAGMLGLMVALVWTASARWYRPSVVTAVVVLCGLIGATVYSLLQERPFTETRVYAIYEHVESLADFSGTHAYLNADAADSGDNNRFRLVWWRTIFNETMAGGPLLGLGFGHDLARGFVLAYDPLMEGDFTARSPHSIFFTVFARMGLVGLLSWSAFMIVLISESWRLAKISRDDTGARDILAAHAMCWVILTSACFGVVLEGPMGAIPFWVLLGFAHGQAHARVEEERSDSEAAAAIAPAATETPTEIIR